MKSKTFVLAAVLSLSIFTPSAHAEEAKVSPTVSPRLRQEIRALRKDTKEEIKDIRETTKDKIKETRQEAKTTITETKEGLKGTLTQTRLESKKSKMTINQNGMYNSFTVRATALVKYQAMIQKRLDAKLIKLPGNAKLLEAQTKLATVTGLTSTYSSDLAKYKSTVDSIAITPDPSTLLVTLKAQAKTVNTDLKNIRQALVDALRLIVKAK